MRCRANSVAAATHFVDRLRLLLPRHSAEDRARPHARQTAANVVLENHHDDDRNLRKKLFEQIEQRDEACPLRQEIDEDEEAQADAHRHRARAAQNEQRSVHDVRDDQDVGGVRQDRQQRARRKEVEKPLEDLEHGLRPRQ